MRRSDKRNRRSRLERRTLVVSELIALAQIQLNLERSVSPVFSEIEMIRFHDTTNFLSREWNNWN